MNQVISIYGEKYPVVLNYRCLRLLTEALGFNSPVTTIKRVSEVFNPLFEAYAGLDENDFDQIDTEKITTDQLELFRELSVCAVRAANDKSTFDIPEEDTFKFFISNASELGVVMTGFIKANFIQEEGPGKQKRDAKPKKK